MAVSLERAGVAQSLGVGWPHPLHDHLRALVDGTDDEVMGQIDGRTVYWVTALQETLTTFYVANDDDGVTLFVQARDLSIIARIRVTSADLARWPALLDS